MRPVASPPPLGADATSCPSCPLLYPVRPPWLFTSPPHPPTHWPPGLWRTSSVSPTARSLLLNHKSGHVHLCLKPSLAPCCFQGKVSRAQQGHRVHSAFPPAPTGTLNPSRFTPGALSAASSRSWAFQPGADPCARNRSSTDCLEKVHWPKCGLSQEACLESDWNFLCDLNSRTHPC